jgi:bacterial/archaeal transporter family protein
VLEFGDNIIAHWIFTYFGLKHLPLSLGSPIRATTPLWTLAGALLILGERPDGLQLLGVITTLAAFFGLSWPGGWRACISTGTNGWASCWPARSSAR